MVLDNVLTLASPSQNSEDLFSGNWNRENEIHEEENDSYNDANHHFDDGDDQEDFFDQARVSIPPYEDEDASVIAWTKKLFLNPVQKALTYVVSIFPIARWILHYNHRWAIGDLVAGITVGIVLVPQSMSYSQLAGLEPQYGLYSSFVGVFVYALFATSKDVSIGPVAVMSMQTSRVLTKVKQEVGEDVSAPVVATVLALLCGGIAAGLGLLRLGFILEFISAPAVMGFMTGSAFTIIVGQVPSLMGIKNVNKNGAGYKIVIETLKKLGTTKSDAAFGLVCLVLLYAWKFLTSFLMRRYRRAHHILFYLQNLRHAVVLIVATAISWGIVHPKLKASGKSAADFKAPFKIIGVVPAGLRDVGPLEIPSKKVISALATELPACVIVLLLEHIAIAKSFGRVNDYKVNPDQELIAIGVNNLIGTFFNAYPSTGSFSRSALKAKCGVRTPLAGVPTGAVVLLALYCLTDAFYYIPKAAMSAVIIHAVSDLMASYKTTWNFWKISPLECGIFVVAVIIAVFATTDISVYFSVCASAANLLFRIAKPKGVFLGKVKVAEVVNPIIQQQDYSDSTYSSSSKEMKIQQVLSSNSADKGKVDDKKETYFTSTKKLVKDNPDIQFHTRWVPLTHDYVNSNLVVQRPPQGVIVFRPLESFVYPNASYLVDQVCEEAKRLTRRGKSLDYSKVGSRPWNDPGPFRWPLPWPKKFSKQGEQEKEDTRPLLRLVHFDFSCVSQVDVSSVSALVDLKKALSIYADREIEFHFSGIISPWTRRALVNAGFGYPREDGSISDINYVNIVAPVADLERDPDPEYMAAIGTDTPYFHFDIPSY